MTFFETPEEKLERLNAEAERNHTEAEAQFTRGEVKALEAELTEERKERALEAANMKEAWEREHARANEAEKRHAATLEAWGLCKGHDSKLEAQNFELVEELNALKDGIARVGKLLGVQENETYIEAAQRYIAGTAQISNERFMLRGEVTQLKKALIAAEERISFAEQSRDNAIAQRDDVLLRSKAKSQSVARRIEKLVALVELMSDTPLKEEAVRKRLEEILGDERPEPSHIMQLAKCMSLEATNDDEALARISEAVQKHSPWSGPGGCAPSDPDLVHLSGKFTPMTNGVGTIDLGDGGVPLIIESKRVNR